MHTHFISLYAKHTCFHFPYNNALSQFAYIRAWHSVTASTLLSRTFLLVCVPTRGRESIVNLMVFYRIWL